MKKEIIKDWNLYFQLVKFFNEYFNFKQDPNLTQELIDLRDELDAEETREFKKAKEKNDIVGIADGLGDLVYIILGSIWIYEGTILEQKYKDKLDFVLKLISLYFTPRQFYEIFMEIHRSNMTKACKTLDVVYATMAQPKYKDIKYKYVEKDGEYFIIVDEDFPEKGLKKGKLLKSIDYSEANLEFVKQFNKNDKN